MKFVEGDMSAQVRSTMGEEGQMKMKLVGREEEEEEELELELEH